MKSSFFNLTNFFVFLLLTYPPITTSAPVNFSGQLDFVFEDTGSAIYSGNPIGTTFTGTIDSETGAGQITNGSIVTTFSCCALAAGSPDYSNNNQLDADEAAVLNAVAGANLFSAGDLVDIANLEGDSLTPSGGRIEVGLSYILSPDTFSNGQSDNFLFDASDILLTLFFILEEDASGDTDIYDAIGGVEIEQVPGLLLKDNQWVQLSLPEVLSANSTVRNYFADELAAEDYDRLWEVYSYNPQTKQYVDVGIDGVIEQGVGYWMIQLTGSDVLLYLPEFTRETPTTSNAACSEADCFNIPFSYVESPRTWNMVGNPFPFQQPFDGLRVLSGGSTGCENGCTMAQASENELLESRFWRYNATNDSYDLIEAGSVLQPWYGFWASVLPGSANTSLNLLVPKIP